MEITLDCAYMTDRATAHDYLKLLMGFPEYYGRNLDALYDLMTAHLHDVTVTVRNTEFLEANLGGYGAALLAAMKEAAEDNPNITLQIV